jgi:hypothetical protein
MRGAHDESNALKRNIVAESASELLCGAKALMLILNLRASRNCKPVPDQRELVHVEVFPDYEFSRISRADLFL